MDTAKKVPVVRIHPNDAAHGAERARRAIGSILYRGPVLRPNLWESAESSRSTERARD